MTKKESLSLSFSECLLSGKYRSFDEYISLSSNVFSSIMISTAKKNPTLPQKLLMVVIKHQGSIFMIITHLHKQTIRLVHLPLQQMILC